MRNYARGLEATPAGVADRSVSKSAVSRRLLALTQAQPRKWLSRPLSNWDLRVGRKTDVNDAMWITDLLAHGLVSGSFVPPARIQELRDLTRTRKQLVREISQHSLRIQEVLETANVKLASVLADVLCLRGRAMLAAIVAGETIPSGSQISPEAQLARSGRRWSRRCEVTSRRTIVQCSSYTSNSSQRWKQPSRRSDAAMGKALAPISYAAELLKMISGISDVAAHVILAEIGADKCRFPTAGHLIASRPVVSPKRPECRQAPFGLWPQERYVAQDHARHRRVGRRPQETAATSTASSCA